MNVYESGLNDAWEAARKITGENGLDYESLLEIFGTYIYSTIFATNSVSEAIEKIKKYEAVKFKIGDIVRRKDTKDVGVITEITDNNCKVMTKSGQWGIFVLSKVERIGHTEMIKTLTEMLEDFEESAK